MICKSSYTLYIYTTCFSYIVVFFGNIFIYFFLYAHLLNCCEVYREGKNMKPKFSCFLLLTQKDIYANIWKKSSFNKSVTLLTAKLHFIQSQQMSFKILFFYFICKVILEERQWLGWFDVVFKQMCPHFSRFFHLEGFLSKSYSCSALVSPSITFCYQLHESKPNGLLTKQAFSSIDFSNSKAL